MKRKLKIAFGLLAAGTVLLVSDPNQVSNLFVAQAEAVIGRPMTPVSYAGVARRTTRRTVYAASVQPRLLPTTINSRRTTTTSKPPLPSSKPP